jgi:lysyl-tRNA synthetase class 2
MAELNELKAERLKKLEKLKVLGIDPYPARINLPGERVSSEKAKLTLEKNTTPDVAVCLAGRVMSIRGQGKILFVDLSDQEGKFQIVLKVDVLGEERIKVFFENIDGGDIVAFTGKLFITARGEKSLEATDFQVLSKSLLPMPSTFYGLENEEEVVRKRYLDFALNKEKRELFFRKAKFWNTIREFMNENNFLEVVTPSIETTTGGAEARPFKTFHNDFDMEVFMRICVGELWQKRLLSGGFEKVFEIGKAYRNEGSSPMHLQEFTNCEFYWSYADYNDGMNFVKELYTKIAKEVYGKTEFTLGEHTFDFKDEWKLIKYIDEVKKQTGIDLETATLEEMKQKLVTLGVKWDGVNRERLTDSLWKYCRKKISGPAFLVDHPSLVGPLAKPSKDGKTVQMFQPIFAGTEVGRGFSELNDPEVQRKNFEQQQKLLESGDDEAMMPDWEFVEMLEHGMPPAFGFGFGDRMFSILEGLSMRETELFPLVKPKAVDK